MRMNLKHECKLVQVCLKISEFQLIVHKYTIGHFFILIDSQGMIRLEDSPPPRWPAISLRRAFGSFSCIEKEIDGDGREWVGLHCGRFEGGERRRRRDMRSTAATVIMVSTPRWARTATKAAGNSIFFHNCLVSFDYYTH